MALFRLNQAYFVTPPLLKVNSAANQYAGLVTVNSGTQTATFSSTMIKSDSLVVRMLAHVSANSHRAIDQTPQIASLVDGSYVTFRTSLATVDDQDVQFLIANAV